MKKKKAMYLRKSRQGEDQDALGTHRATLISLAERNNWDDYDIYEEITSSVLRKPELENLFSNIEQYDGILTMNIHRFSRDKEESFRIEKLLASNNVIIYTPNGNYDLNNKTDSFRFGIESILGAEYYNEVKALMKNGKINRFKNGEYSIGGAPYGYKVENKKLVIDEAQATIVREVFELASAGHGRNAISKKTGHPASNVRWMMLNKTYIGQVVVEIKNNKGDVIETLTQSCPPIVDIETFVKVQEEVKRRTTNPLKIRGVTRSFVQGLVRCDECKNQMRVTKSGGDENVFILRCSTKNCPTTGIKMDFIDDYVLNQLDDVLSVLNGVLMDKMKESAPSSLETEIKDLRDDLRKSENKLSRLKDAYFDEGDIPKEEFKERKSRIDKEINELKLKLKSLEIKLAREDGRTDIKDLKRLIADIERMDNLDDVVEQHDIMKRLIDKIEYARIVPKGTKRKTVMETHPPSINIIYRTWD